VCGSADQLFGGSLANSGVGALRSGGSEEGGVEARRAMMGDRGHLGKIAFA
jgi:hypothetical protein